MTQRDNEMSAEPTEGTSRRNLISKAGISAAAVAFLGSMGPVGELLVGKAAHAQSAITDTDILNFALQLEYLEGEYYTRGVSGVGLANNLTGGTGTLGPVNGGTLVPFANPVFFQAAARIATDEQGHIAFLRSQLGSAALARPTIDLAGGFQGAAVAAGLTTSAVQFNPFADEISFFLGAFTLTEVGVTAYAGAAALISSSAVLSAAASILAAEGYHAGAIRGLLSQSYAGMGTPGDVAEAAAVPFQTQAIANLQDRLTGTITTDGIINPANGHLQFTNTDGNSLNYRRTPAQVINIVEAGNGANHAGGFFPIGFNGNIR